MTFRKSSCVHLRSAWRNLLPSWRTSKKICQEKRSVAHFLRTFWVRSFRIGIVIAAVIIPHKHRWFAFQLPVNHPDQFIMNLVNECWAPICQKWQGSSAKSQVLQVPELKSAETAAPPVRGMMKFLLAFSFVGLLCLGLSVTGEITEGRELR